jgi:uncharacterized protein GlcG (DUF336 family)
VVDPAGDLLAFQGMDGVRPASADLAIEKARTAARLQRSTAEIEDNINQGRTAFVTAGVLVLRGGMPIRVNGAVVGAVGVAGLSKEIDAEIANTAAAALSPSPMTAQRLRVSDAGRSQRCGLHRGRRPKAFNEGTRGKWQAVAPRARSAMEVCARRRCVRATDADECVG